MVPPSQKRHLATVVFSLKAAVGAALAAVVNQWLALKLDDALRPAFVAVIIVI
jgi:hypothetical protein